jgi:hypothetical protein
MSGLKNSPGQGSNFVNFKDGKLISNKESYTDLTGIVTELDIQDEEYKGKEYRKVVLFIKDEDGEIWKLGFPLESGYGTAFCSIASNIDFAKPVMISGGTKELDNGNSYGVMFIRQGMGADGKGGESLKWRFKSDSPEVPKGEDVVDKKGKKTGTDWSERNDWFHHFLVEKVRPRILEGAKRAEKNETETDKKMSKMGSFKKGAAAPEKDGLPF